MKGSRSTALQPWHWTVFLLSVLLVGLVAAEHAPSWLLKIVTGCFVAAVLADGFAYFYFMLKSPDSLRSERFTLDKMRIERGVFGDSVRGLEADTVSQVETKLITSGDGP